CYLLAFLALAASLNAQSFQPLTEIETELGQQAQAFSFQDAEGVTLLFQERGQARIFLLDPNMKLRQSFVLNNLPQRSNLRPLGFTNRTDALHFYYLDLETGVYEAFSVSKQDGRSEQYRLNLRERRAHLHAGAFTYQGTLHIVRMPKGSNVIRLCKFEDGGDFDTREIVLQREDFAQKVDYQLTTIHPDSTIELAHTWQNAKMYQYGPYLYLSLDEAGRTYLAEIDLTSGRQSERSLAAPSLGPDPLHYKANSLLWQDILIQFATSEDSLKIQLRDLRSGAVMSQYAYGRDQKIDIMQGQLLYQSAEGANQTVKNTSEFLSYCADAPKLAVAAKSLPDSLLIFVAGAVRPVQERGLSGIVLSESYETVWFETQLDLISLAPALPIASSPRWARAQEKRPQQIQFDWQKQDYVGYYDRRRGKFVIGRK
ncbi:MAG: hypothetical protein AAFP02_07420, partial [Bacteroidota bacterium]